MAKKKVKKGNGMKFVAVAVFVAVIIVVSFFVKGTFLNKTYSKSLEFKDIGELATQTAYCEQVSVLEKAREILGLEVPFTKSKLIYSYNVEIKAGYDFTQIEAMVDNEKKLIEVKLPEVKILSKELKTDSFKVYFENESLFRRISLKESNMALDKLIEDAVRESKENGLFANARANAEVIIKGFIAGMGDFREYKIEFMDKK